MSTPPIRFGTKADDVKALADKGMGAAEIAKTLGIVRASVYNGLRSLPLPIARRRL